MKKKNIKFVIIDKINGYRIECSNLDKLDDIVKGLYEEYGNIKIKQLEHTITLDSYIYVYEVTKRLENKIEYDLWY